MAVCVLVYKTRNNHCIVTYSHGTQLTMMVMNKNGIKEEKDIESSTWGYCTRHVAHTLWALQHRLSRVAVCVCWRQDCVCCSAQSVGATILFMTITIPILPRRAFLKTWKSFSLLESTQIDATNNKHHCLLLPSFDHWLQALDAM